MENSNVLPKRSEVRKEDKWAIEDLYANDQIWEKDYDRLVDMAAEFKTLQGTMKDSSAALLIVLKEQDSIQMYLEKVYVYANQKSHEDTGNSEYQALSGKASALMAQIYDATSFVEPELLEIPEETLKKWLKENSGLALYERYIMERLREKEHILSHEMEAVMAKVHDIAKGPEKIFSMFNNADINFGQIPDEKSEMIELTQGRYITFLESHNRDVRKAAFIRLYETYGRFKNTLAATYQTNLQQNLFFAKMRNYTSTLEMALDGSRIPTEVYHQLIEAVHNYLPSMYQYVELRKKVLAVDELHMYDVHVPMVENATKKIPFDQAREIVKEGLALLGKDYIDLLDEGFNGGWIDIYENQNKRSGAYSWGAYGTHPYVLLNYNNNLNNVFTLAHEMGHALHSYYSDKSQPYTYAGYKIFVAEVASTCNEALLIHYLIGHAKDDEERAYLINYFLDQFKGTLFRQTMFAEFEKITHQMLADGASLTVESLSKVYYQLNEEFFGPDMCVDQEIAMEWARIPHFYTPFYVYQYATGFSAAIAISQKIINGELGIVEAYKKFLSGGSSMDCVELLKICGVDMTRPEPVEDALKVFEKYLGELQALLGK